MLSNCKMLAAILLLLFVLTDVLKASEDESLLIVDNEEAEETTQLPNAHSAAFVMGFIFLCVFAYGLYRLFLSKCAKKKQPMTVDLESEMGSPDGITEHSDYLAIYGPRKSVDNVLQYKPNTNAHSNSNGVQQNRF